MAKNRQRSQRFPLPPALARSPGPWIAAPEEPSHPLAQLHGRFLGQHGTCVFLGPRNRFGARYFQMFLLETAGSLSREPVLAGLHAAGPLPSYNWIEVTEARRSVPLERERTAGIGERGLREFLCLLGQIVVPGGHLMVEYDGPDRVTTARALARGVPPLATSLGVTLLAAGCGPGIRDWYISEGGREGPRKLQGYKPLSEADARERGRRAARELLVFLDSLRLATEDTLQRAARRRAPVPLAPSAPVLSPGRCVRCLPPLQPPLPPRRSR
jgi:hypothetical protein